MAQASVFVLWQSLVVGAYRSFFAHLARLGAARVALAAPASFREAANQLVACEPFHAPFRPQDARTPAYVLPARAAHVQAVWFSGLRGALRQFFRGAAGRRIFLCIAEPYSLTAFFAYLAARGALGRELEFVCYAAQNIAKRQPWALRAIQKFLFSRSAVILAVGAEQAAVLRAAGYAGEVIAFPLWFDRARFSLAARPARPLTVGYAGGLTEAKGVLDLLAACENDPEIGRARLRVAGAGPLAAAVGEACARLRARGTDAQALGALPLDAMPEFYRSLDVLVVPSRTTTAWKEQFGRVIVEAMACGVLVTGSRSGEIPRVIGAEERVFAEGDPLDLARVVNAALKRLEPAATRDGLRAAEAARAAGAYADDVLAQALADRLGLRA